MSKQKNMLLLLTFVYMLLCSTAFASAPDYADKANWAYWRQGENKQVDLFLICPTVDLGSPNRLNMSLADNRSKASFIGALNMEKGIYEKHCRMYAPFYRQGTLHAYSLPNKENGAPFTLAYSDVKKAFQYYLRYENKGRPFILAGFSQGGDMCIRLLKDFGSSNKVKDKLIACYALGWRLEPQDVERFQQLRPAQLRTDVGVIITLNTEAPFINSSLMVPAGKSSYAINPLSWRCTNKPAHRAFNMGSCFTNYSGQIYKEIPALTGGYLDMERGVMKLTDISAEDYPPILDIFEPGIYHLYDYQFFYRNLQQNVGARIKAYNTYQRVASLY